MFPSPYCHLDEIAQILATAILRIEATKTETKEIDKYYNGTSLDFNSHSSITEGPL